MRINTKANPRIKSDEKRSPKPDTRFQKGNRASVGKGRPVGSGIIGKLREQLQEAAPGIITQLITNARNNDALAIRLLVERVYPITKPELPTVAIDLPDNASALERATSIAMAAHRGEISPTIAQAFIGLQADIAKLRELEELESRISVLEAKAGSQ